MLSTPKHTRKFALFPIKGLLDIFNSKPSECNPNT